MGRDIPLEAQKGNLNKDVIERKKLIEEATFVGSEQLEIVPEWLINKVAINEWLRLTKEFSKTSIVSNLDYNNLGAYCNAFAKWQDITEKLKVDILVGDEINPLVQVELKYSDEMKRFGNLLGLSIGSRIIKGKTIQESDEDKIKDELGGI